MASEFSRALWRHRKLRHFAAAALFCAVLFPWFNPAGREATALGAQSGEVVAAPPTRTAPPASHSQTPRSTSSARASSSRYALRSKIALVVDGATSRELLVKNADRLVPIASITKLMTAMVVLDAKLPMGEMLKISDDDVDLEMGTGSRLRVGWALSREDMLHLALMSSENRAAAALSRYYPGGRPAFIQAMNDKATELGMTKTHFVNPNGLTSENVSSAYDLVKMVRAAAQYPLICQFTTDPHYNVRIGRYVLLYINSNRLVGRPDWNIEVQKTGFTNEAGRCLVMQVEAEGRSLIMVLLDAYGTLTRFADARRVLMQLALTEKR